MTDTDRPLCDCPEPCGCYAEGYAAGKDKAYFEIKTAVQDDTHAAGCGCQTCQVKRACLRKVTMLMPRSLPGLWRSRQPNGKVKYDRRLDLPDLGPQPGPSARGL